ncbi:cyclic nucleotide-binding domain-containing protein [Corallococcus silvisoli]|uniref:cyclic nucleotide-binding domain-containing protein n=1 Tax=Corallococcus silvisoli TaxID=2697031 RepID=UPI0013783BB4|nr:cyclic nucleotide-binding domain-containing protein [Corallococcus silvisoli]NBD11102.1 cyclic nucleotide-binding domain-containing protein [Corallococcus silvisoli]
MESRALKDKATEAFSKGRFAKAAELYADYCQAEPKDHQSRLRMGDAWAKAGQRDRAVSAYHSAAEGFAREGFLPRAIAASKLILELDPAHQGVQQMLADLYARRGTPATARAKPGDATAPRAPTSLVTHREVPPSPPDAEGGDPKVKRPEPLEAEGAPVDLSDSLPPELTMPTAAVADDGEVVISVEVEAAPRQDAPEAPGANTARGADHAPVSATPPPTSPRPTADARRAPEAFASPSEARPTAAPTEATPPGLSTRVAPPPLASMPELPQVRTPSGRWKALAPPIADTDPSEPKAPAQAAPPGLRPRRTDAPAAVASTASATTEAPPKPPSTATAAGASVVPTTSGAPEPWRASLRVSSFTELEIEADSLLHAVELAAQRGLADHAPEADEQVLELTEEAEPTPGTWDTLPAIPLFSDLPRDAFIQLFERCPLRRFGPGERILAQGSHGHAFYVICEGRVRVFREEDGRQQDLATLEGGAFFGEMALLSGAPRAASVESASDDTQVLEISASVLATLSRSHPPVAKALKKFCRERLLANVMSSSALFRPFNRKDRRGLVERFRARDVSRGDVIIREGDPTDGLYVVLSGEVEVHKGGHVLSRLKEGELFGEISLLQKTPATATVAAARHTTLLRLPREDFDSLISSHPQVLMLVADLSDQRLRRTQHVLDAAGAPLEGDEEDLILV